MITKIIVKVLLELLKDKRSNTHAHEEWYKIQSRINEMEEWLRNEENNSD